MKLKKIEIKACGYTVTLNFKEPADVDEDVDVISILDRHARKIQSDLASAKAYVSPSNRGCSK